MMSAYQRAPAPIAAAWPEGPAYSKTPAEEPAPDVPWRTYFADPMLQCVIETALANNRDLRLASLNAERVKVLYAVQRSELYPSITAFGGGARQRASADLTPPDRERTTEQYDLNLGIVSWELDFFGRIRSLKEKALQEVLATEEARRSAQIALVSATAVAYLELAADRENLNLAKATLKTQEGAYALIARHVEAGLATEMDLRRAQTQLDAARGEISRFTQETAQDRNALNLLVGEPIPDESLPRDWGDIIESPDLYHGVSSEILLNRPDIMAAEARLRAANADIGAARAGLFPRIQLTSAFGTASEDLSGLFGSGSGTWSFVPTFVAPVFDERAKGAYRVSKVTREITLAEYEKAIQTAFREVADALAVQGTIHGRIAAQESVVDSLTTVVDLAEKRYLRGLVSYLDVLDAQRSLFAASEGLNALRCVRAANQARLYAALGGGKE